MKKMKLLSFVLSGILAVSSICTSTSHATVTVTLPEDFSEFTVIDDKGMLAEDDYYKREGYKMLYFSPYEKFYRADPAYRYLKFILNEDVNYEDVNEKIVEIFKEFYPENNLDATYDDMISPDYANNYKPSLYSKTVDDVTTYTVCVSYKTVSSIDDERVANAKKYSTDFMKKLNEENLISAFYDFGEVYEVSDCGKTPDFRFDINVDIELINKYISENNIDCIIENVDDNYYVMNFNDDTDKLEQFLTAVDIYEATSIKIDSWASIESSPIIMCGKNALEDISSSDTIITAPTINFGTPTIAGDIDLNNEQGIADIVVLSKYIANSELYPITDSTALANADMNQDKEINSLDASILVELSLGTYESAV